MEVPLIALIAPMRRADAGAGAACACGAGGAADATAGGEASGLAAKNKLDKMVAGKIVAGKIIDRIDVLVLRIRPSINLHALLAPEWLIYKVLPEAEFTKKLNLFC
jgi:hypothetical protein